MIIAISGKIGSGKDTIGKIIQYLVGKNPNDFQLDEWLQTVHYHDSEWQIKKFADGLKDMVCIMLGCTREQLEDHEFKNKELGEEWNCYIFNNGKKEELTLDYDIAKTLSADNRIIVRILTPRLLLQLLGTDCGRDIIHPNIWVNSLMSEYKMNYAQHPDINYIESKQYPNWIITDTRFPNELEAIKKRSGISIRVNRILTPDNVKECINRLSSVLSNEHPSETVLDNAEFDYTIDNSGTIEDLIEKVKDILIKENII